MKKTKRKAKKPRKSAAATIHARGWRGVSPDYLLHRERVLRSWGKVLTASGITADSTPPTPISEQTLEERVEHCMEFIDERGQRPLPKEQWVEMLESIISECRTRITATREEMREETKGKVRT
jgi:hypothetical protein